MVTGVDWFVKQLRIANGEQMSVDSLNIRGHSIEVRLYAEDATNNFLPAIGPYDLPSAYWSWNTSRYGCS